MDDYQFDAQDAQDFWRGYDSPALSPPTTRFSSSIPSVSILPPTESTRSSSPYEPKTLLSEEDSYWASYGAVQGTADSTVPSPRIQMKPDQDLDEYGRLVLQTDGDLATGEDKDVVVEATDHVYDISDAHDSYLGGDRFFLGSDAFAPAHQRALALALAQASPRPPGGFGFEEEEELEDINTLESSSPSTAMSEDSADADLKMAIRGMYNLWKNGTKLEERACREAFLAVVSDALDT